MSFWPLGVVWHTDLVDSVLAGARGFVSMLPISVLEARQHGFPLVLTDIPGYRDGAATAPAVFVPVDDTAAFAEHILALLHDTRPHEPDTTTLRGKWERYTHTFLSIVAPVPQTAASSHAGRTAGGKNAKLPGHRADSGTTGVVSTVTGGQLYCGGSTLKS